MRVDQVVSTLDVEPKITVFALLNGLGTNETIEGQVVHNFLGFTPDLKIGQSYGGVHITKEGECLFANGYEIMKQGVPIKNGAVHFLDNVSYFTRFLKGLLT